MRAGVRVASGGRPHFSFADTFFRGIIASAVVLQERTTPPDEAPPSLLPANEELVPALVVVWSEDEPWRAGEVALFSDLRAQRVLGRGDGLAQVRFFRQRPNALDAVPPIGSEFVSREQLLIARTPAGLRTERRGQPGMLVNGMRCEHALLSSGDTIEIERRMLLLCTERPARMPALRYGRVDGGFAEPDAHGILGESPAVWRLRDELGYAREASGHVLITGESGTGKELAARALHAGSRRAGRALVAHNAATFPSGLIDAELFGNPKNYPNPGMAERPGLVGEANGGVLFLDEIGELPGELHARLLRVLDSDGEYKRLGEATTRRSDFRFVAATNRDPSALKHDLLSRLRLRVTLPSLRERREDIPLLARAIVLEEARVSPTIAGRFVREVCGRLEVKISPALMDALVRWPYTTNVREIATLLSCAMAQSGGTTLKVPREMTAKSPSPVDEEISKPRVLAALGGDCAIAKAAERLGVSRQAVYRLMKKYGITRARGASMV